MSFEKFAPGSFTFTPPPNTKVTPSGFLQIVEQDRSKTAISVQQFEFNEKRVRLLSNAQEPPKTMSGVVYWMSRDQRVQDNWALLYAQKLALKNKVALHLCFCLVPKFLDATIRHFKFMLDGLNEVQKECSSLGLPFHLLKGEAPVVLPNFVKQHKIGTVVTDFSPLRVPMKWVDGVKCALPSEVPFYQVDAHNIVPCWIASDMQEIGAFSIRGKITSKLPQCLTPFPQVIKHPFAASFQPEPINWSQLENDLQVDRSVGPVSWATPGSRAALTELNEFCQKRLKHYAEKRNIPTENAVSNLAPWIHFGQISVQRIILTVNQYKTSFYKSVETFVDEAITWRELSDNFCFYNKQYDSFESAPSWAQETLNNHRSDKRRYLYSQEQFDKAQTHDNLWNASQLQMVHEGKMHGFLRMYWAKMILEWTESPEEAVRIAIYLNDRYSLDGRDPNGYAGIMWSICGVHDRAFQERQVYGKIRCMTYEASKRKFDVPAFITRYVGKNFPK